MMIRNIIRPLVNLIHNHSCNAQPVVGLLRKEIATTRCMCTESTYKNKVTAVNAFEKFVNEKWYKSTPYSIADLTPDHIKAFEHWLLNKGYSPNYASLHMRCLRALLNRIDGSGSLLFKHVRTSNCQTVKRALNEQTIRDIRDKELPRDSNMAAARHIFMFCFYCMGMPLIDAVMLKKSQLKDGYISYCRQKTGRLVNIPVSPQLAQLIQQLPATTSPYLLPVITATDRAGAYHQYKNFYQRYRRQLQKLSHMLTDKPHLTSYVVRHSWASIAYQHNGNINAISRACGHSNANTTYLYIRDISDTELVEIGNIVAKAVM